MDISFFEIRARNTFGLAGGIVTAYGLMRYSTEVRRLSLSVSRNLFYAGITITFVFYSIFAGTVASYPVLPYLSIPVEVLRGLSAVLITCLLIKALDIFDIETREKIEQRLKRLAQSEKFIPNNA